MKNKEYRAKLSSKNQLSLPAGISAFLNVSPGDSVRFELTEHGVAVSPVPVRERLAPLVGSRRKGFGKTRGTIDAEIRALRGPR